jgi:hypothetical protein
MKETRKRMFFSDLTQQRSSRASQMLEMALFKLAAASAE